MPKLQSKKEGVIPGNTWDTFIEIGFKALNSGDARYLLRETMRLIKDELPNVVMLKHGQEPWTSNNHREDTSDILLPYKTKMEIRIFSRDKMRARQELSKVLKLWKINQKMYNIYRIYRFGKDWSD